MIGACVPFVPLTDFTPQMDGGSATTGHCIGLRRTELTLDSVLVRTSLRVYPHVRKGRAEVQLRFIVPAGRTVELDSDQMLLSTLPVGDATPIRIPGFSTTNVETRELAARTPMVGGARTFGERTYVHEYWANVPLDAVPEGDVRVTFPQIAINGKAFAIPPVAFQRTPRVAWMVPLNC